MAQRVQVMLVDDIDGSDAEETVTFGLDGVTYEIDLNVANAARLRDDLATWVGHARRSGGRRAAAKAPSRAQSRGELTKIREWARKNGHQVSDRGRISAEVKAAYEKAH
ncbi:MAG: Lsr2 family protein [Micrococcales bacterium]|nr:Lsr2 family protein [Micrococcales bacterium]